MENNGILTAGEISELNLSDVDLFVLSCCQSGITDFTMESGLMYGLKQAGVNSIMGSLWNVDDGATQLLMTKFYEELVSGKTKVESLRLAQNYVRNYIPENPDGEKPTTPYSDPKYWAAFIDARD
ncbi:MAG: CHAT domain-containing protein [Bacteroidales bacterium]|nr:CHAT domain-containing protein [Bacteroidales bacterium]